MREVISVIGRMSERFAHNVSFGSRLRVWNGSHGRCLAESISFDFNVRVIQDRMGQCNSEYLSANPNNVSRVTRPVISSHTDRKDVRLPLCVISHLLPPGLRRNSIKHQQKSNVPSSSSATLDPS